MTKIPPALREEMSNDPFYKKCCLSYHGNCNGRIEWHHSLIYGGKQVQAKFAILPVCHYHHDRMSKYNENCVHIALQRATDDEIRSITKAINYFKERDKLLNIYGRYNYIG